MKDDGSAKGRRRRVKGCTGRPLVPWARRLFPLSRHPSSFIRGPFVEGKGQRARCGWAGMPFDPEDNTFLLAGPVKIHPRVRAALAKPAVAHRDPGLVDVNRRMQERLREVFLTASPVVA